MTAPHRLQRSRRKGWRKPEGAVICTRPGRWGNNFRVGDVLEDGEGESSIIIETPQQAVALFARYIDRALAGPGGRHLRQAMDAELRGRDLMCWCSLCQPCHVDVWLVRANAPRCEAV